MGWEKLDDHKIAFIMCVNDTENALETEYYINQLRIPKGYSTDIITVYDAESMAAGYNAAMKSSDAGIKVYLHQDTRIINRNFIGNVLSAFREDRMIGVLGCIGCCAIPLNGQTVSSWDTGMIYHNCIPYKTVKAQNENENLTKVEALDGLLLVTRYDIPWREDLFDGWDFYDISQCLEMQRAGYQVAVPFQTEPWCYHDNTYSKMQHYQKYCDRMISEYQDIKPFYRVEPSDNKKELNLLKETSRKELRKLVENDNKKELIQIFDKPENRGWGHLKEFELLADITRKELAAGKSLLWEDGDSYEDVWKRIKSLHFKLKRLEYHDECENELIKECLQRYTIEAIKTVLWAYTDKPEPLWKKIQQYGTV